MNTTVFTEFEFWALIVFSFVFPLGIYALLLSKRAISRTNVLLFGLALVGIAGVDVYLLQSLASLARLTHSPLDEKVFLSEVSLALYLLPAMFGGVGINLVSHVLVNHLLEAEKRFKDEHPDP
jgi:hypothetical protein